MNLDAFNSFQGQIFFPRKWFFRKISGFYDVVGLDIIKWWLKRARAPVNVLRAACGWTESKWKGEEMVRKNGRSDENARQ